ncbi:hypothetical protein GQ457_18G025850 [Hibiscus cannabinus]
MCFQGRPVVSEVAVSIVQPRLLWIETQGYPHHCISWIKQSCSLYQAKINGSEMSSMKLHVVAAMGLLFMALLLPFGYGQSLDLSAAPATALPLIKGLLTFFFYLLWQSPISSID